MFSGTSRERRVVVGGSRASTGPVSQAEIVAAARREREARAAARQQLEAAVTLQRHARGSLTRGRDTFMTDAASKLADLQRVDALLKAAGRVFVAPAPLLAAVTRPLAVLAWTRRLRRRYVGTAGIACQLWRGVVTSADFRGDTQNRVLIVGLLRTVFSLCLDTLCIPSAGDDAALAAAVEQAGHLVAAICNPATWPGFTTRAVDEQHRALRWGQAVARDLAASHAAEVLFTSSALTSFTTLAPSPAGSTPGMAAGVMTSLRTVIVNLTVTACSSAAVDVPDAAAARTLSLALAHPGIADTMATQIILHGWAPLPLLLSCAARSLSTMPSPLAATTLGNVVTLMLACTATAPTQANVAFGVYHTLIASLVRACPLAMFLSPVATVASVAAHDEPDTEDAVMYTSDEDAAHASPTAAARTRSADSVDARVEYDVDVACAAAERAVAQDVSRHPSRSWQACFTELAPQQSAAPTTALSWRPRAEAAAVASMSTVTASSTNGKRARMEHARGSPASWMGAVSMQRDAAFVAISRSLNAPLLRTQLEQLWSLQHVQLLLASAGADNAQTLDALSVLETLWRALRLKESIESHAAGASHPSAHAHRAHGAGSSLLLAAVTAAVAASPAASVVPVSGVHAIWISISQNDALLPFRRNALAAAVESPSLAAAQRLFLAAMEHSLITLDDLELFDQEKLMPLQQVRDVQAFLRALTFRLFWADAPDTPLSGRGLDALLLMQSAQHVYNMLFDRHERQALVAADAWLWPALPSTELNADVFMGISEDVIVDEAMTSHSLAAGVASAAPPSMPDASGPDAVMHDDGAAAGSMVAPAQHVSAARRARQCRAQLVLTAMPQTVPFDTRIAIFTKLRQRDRQDNAPLPVGHPLLDFEMQPRVQFTVRRTALVEDSFRAFASIARRASASTWKQPFQIQFINKEGLPEAGIDGGGLLKEFVDSVVREAFSPQYALFAATDDHTLYPHAGMLEPDAGILAHYEFLGRLLGKALYEGILVEPRFAGFFLRKLLGRANLMDDLRSLDVEVYRSLMQLKKFDDATLRSMELAFELSQERLGIMHTVPLVSGGHAERVDASNVLRYIVLVANHRLNDSIAPQCRAFLRGFRELIPVLWMRMFSPVELQTLIGGSERDVDLSDLRAHTHYSNGYADSQPYVQSFWQVLSSFSREDMKAFLMFTTSCSRAPLLGFGTLQPKFAIARVPIAADADRLPSSGTCMNLLKLPQYSSPAVLREKLLYAIHSGAGFELS